MPRVPRAVRPMARAAVSLKRTALPASLTSMTSASPSVSATPIKWSPRASFTAMMPDGRGREKSESLHFLTMPAAVAMTTYFPAPKFLTGKTVVTCSPSPSGSRFTSGLPRACRPACGSLNTRSQ